MPSSIEVPEWAASDSGDSEQDLQPETKVGDVVSLDRDEETVSELGRMNGHDDDGWVPV